MKREVSPWVTEPKPQARLRLLCFPYAGGSALIYRNWSENLPAEIEVYALQLPGRGGRMQEPAATHLTPLIEAIAQAIMPHLDKPFAFFGHSMGALISFELARYLRTAQARLPAQLFVSGRAAPQVLDTDPPTYDLPEDQFIEELRRLGGTPREVLEHPELMSLMMPLLRADFSVCQTYSYRVEPPLDCPITVLGGLQDNHVTREKLDAWRAQTISNFKLHMLPGDHFFLNTHQAQLLRIVSQALHQLLKTKAAD